MAREKFKKTIEEKGQVIGILVISVLVLIVGLKAVNAYYHQENSVGVLAGLIGNFDIPEGDINMIFYKEDDSGNFSRSYSIPKYGYRFDNTLTTCTTSCALNDTSKACNYSYDDTNKEFTLVSDKRVTCEFYFKKEMTSDIDVYLLKQVDAGEYNHDNKQYTLINNIPAFGYTYDSYVCNNGSTLTFNAETRKVTVAASQRDKCYVYFDKGVDADIVVNVFVQESEGANTYKQVDNIPGGRVYKLSEVRTSSCKDTNDQLSSAGITYDGFINIDNIVSKQECNVYLDLK